MQTKKLKVEFYAGTWKVGSEVRETKIIEVDADASEKEIEATLDSAWQRWMIEQIDTGYEIKEASYEAECED